MQQAFTDCISSASEELTVEIARSAKQILQAKQIRYRVYCEERGFETGDGGVEQDAYDRHATHVLVRSRNNGRVFGTVRVVRPPEDGSAGFPMQDHCPAHVLAHFGRRATGEVSRFALLRDRSGLSPAAAALLRLCLIQGVIRVSSEHRLTHLCALMEGTLLRLLRASGIHFTPIGQAIDHRGIRHPSVWHIANGLQRVWRDSPQVWQFITGDGAVFGESAASMAEVA